MTKPTKAQRRAAKADAKARRRAHRAQHSTTVRRPIVHLVDGPREGGRLPKAACPDGLRRVDQRHAFTAVVELVDCPGCMATPAFAVAVERSKENG